MTELDVDIAPAYVESTVEGHRTHIVRPIENGWAVAAKGASATGQDIVDLARLTGTEVTALCGYTWVPQHNPEKFPACEKCIDIAGQIMREERL